MSPGTRAGIHRSCGTTTNDQSANYLPKPSLGRTAQATREDANCEQSQQRKHRPAATIRMPLRTRPPDLMVGLLAGLGVGY